MATAATFQQSAATQNVRAYILDAATRLGRPYQTYLGLPGRDAKDIICMRDLLKHVICVDTNQEVLEECALKLSRLSLESRKYELANVWNYLCKTYPAEPLHADVTFL